MQDALENRPCISLSPSSCLLPVPVPTTLLPLLSLSPAYSRWNFRSPSAVQCQLSPWITWKHIATVTVPSHLPCAGDARPGYPARGLRCLLPSGTGMMWPTGKETGFHGSSRSSVPNLCHNFSQPSSQILALFWLWCSCLLLIQTNTNQTKQQGPSYQQMEHHQRDLKMSHDRVKRWYDSHQTPKHPSCFRPVAQTPLNATPPGFRTIDSK